MEGKLEPPVWAAKPDSCFCADPPQIGHRTGVSSDMRRIFSNFLSQGSQRYS